MFDHLLESSRWDDSNKWSYIGFDEEMSIVDMKLRILSGALVSWMKLVEETGFTLYGVRPSNITNSVDQDQPLRGVENTCK